MKISYILGAIVVLVFCDAATAVEITVGGASDWGLGFNYTTWASSQTFTVGDTLGTYIFVSLSFFLSSSYVNISAN